MKTTYIDPGASIIGDVKLGENNYVAVGARVMGNVTTGDNVTIWPNVVMRADQKSITVGNNTNIQDGTVCHISPAEGAGHDCVVKLGDNVTIGHSCIIHGCTVGDNSLIGMGSIVMNDAVIGKNCIIGAGSLITERTVIPDGVMVFGRPGKVIRELRPDEIEHNLWVAEHYVEEGQMYRPTDEKA